LSLRRLVANLVDNSLKYGERVRLPAAAFKPYFRAETSRIRDTAGIGPGLTIVRSIVLEHVGFRMIVSPPWLGQ